ncbi:MAG: cytochrome c3 family protein [Betaproteobacteria bacterium]|nr:cytochrome c3 family protein [Betaproteobacteria bacterium]
MVRAALLAAVGIVGHGPAHGAEIEGRAQLDVSNNSVCLGCHSNPVFATPGADEKIRSLHVSEAVFAASVHGKMQFPCVTCHVRIKGLPHKKPTVTPAEWRRSIPDLCGNCHAKQRAAYEKSVHGDEVIWKNNAKAAVCSDCHRPHEVERPATASARLAITQNCGNCHANSLKSYTQTYHGQITRLGYAYTAKCFNCHGSHGIQRTRDPNSKVHPDNRLKTCQQCHTGATKGFVTFEPHANTHDYGRYPYMWAASKFMIALLLSVFAFFWTHSTLWFYREYRDRRDRRDRREGDRREDKSAPHVVTGELPQLQGKHFSRFGPAWRIAHLAFAGSVMMLVLTGMAVLYAETGWAKFIVGALGGPRAAGILHRVSAAIMLGIFFIHLVYMAIRVVPTWKLSHWFGPTSLVPNWKDLRDMLAMFEWFLGKGPRPAFDRWTYWEKFDYWAVFWGMAIIGGSGMMLAFKETIASVLPGWVFNVATLVHGEEAILAAVFLFTVHFFNNHFRPDKFPLDIVMFTGAIPLEEFKREHTLEYKRLVQTGQLEKYLVDAPSQPMTLGSTLLGFTLIGVGLTLLVLVFVGFAGVLNGS